MENESQPEEPQEEQPVDFEQGVEEIDEANVSKVSVLSSSFEPKLSSILEENDSGVPLEWELPIPTLRPQAERYEKLARPKVQHLEETLDRFEKCKKDEMNERIMRIKMRLRELRGPEKRYSHTLQNERTSEKLSRNSEVLYKNLQRNLRKVAFETLAKQIFDKMPELIVKMQHTRGQTSTPEMTVLLDTLQTTLHHYLGQPTNEHEDRIFNHLCYGLAKFIENIVENVHANQQECERVAAKEELSPNGSPGIGRNVSTRQYPVAVQLARKAYKERQTVVK
ncbi:uncharacterized protein LOC118504350 [Anopheles stephensi]|uniref:uncharacterized protein LOC118504350 n=1 Tax=Anopheles stephensi TaxID=30069 RepID=UPI0016589C35|nr:uncharacterized protein LOC118504350 [Anopheles stephensi]